MIQIYLISIEQYIQKLAMVRLSLKFVCRLYLILFLIIPTAIFAQPDSIKTRLEAERETQLNQPAFSFDSSFVTNDTFQILSDTTIKFSKDSIESPVEYSADDSMHLEAQTQIVHLYGNGTVKYQEFTIRAAHIILDVEKKIVIAEGMIDSTGRLGGFPVFADDTQEFTAKKIRYNFETQKGIIYNITTEQQGGYIRGGKAKIIVAKAGDSLQIDNQVYSSDAIFTTCDHEVPHFGIRSKKQKVIPNKEVIIGPSNLEIMGIPTPLWLPFGFFPLNIEKSSGLIFPQNYEFNPDYGFGLQGVGWYFNVNDHWDLQLTADAFTRGTYALSARTKYRYRYRSTGGFNIRYDSRRTGDPETPDFTLNNSLTVGWNHSQDAKAHPTQRFTASMNFVLGTNRQVFNDAESVLNNQLSSNISYTKSWTGKPFRLSVSASHFQNTRSRAFVVNLPQLDFQVNRITPFEKKSSGGKPVWYEKIGFNYSLQARNTITATDTTIFTREALNDAQYGVKHTLPINTTFTILKYFQVSPSINYSEKWYFNTTQKTFVDELFIESDTTEDSEGNILAITQDTTFGTVEEFRQNEFKALREFNAGISVGTQIFGTLNNLKIGRLRALRHTVKPSVSYNYTPDYTSEFWGYFDEVQLDTRYPDELQRYSLFEDGIYGQPSASGLSSAIGFSINNIIEGKLQEKGDTTNSVKNFKKFQLLRGANLTGNYNFAADSLKLSTIRFSANTLLFKKITVSFNSVFDAYAANEETNSRINTFEWDKNKRLARMTSAGLTLTTSLRWTEIQDILQGKSKEEGAKKEDKKKLPRQNQGLAYVDNIRLGYDIRLSQKYFDGVDSTYLSTHSISLNGTINLTSQWKITVGRIGYDFVSKQLTYPDFQFYRSLHCWEMGTSWQPNRGTYSFFIRVRQAPLDFIKIPYGQGNNNVIPNF